MATLPIKMDIQNRISRVASAMPLKNINADNTSSFAMGRQIYVESPLTHTTNLKKKFFCNRDASDVAARKRSVQVGKGSINYAGSPIAFSSTSDVNYTQRSLTRVRNGGSAVPPKVTNKYVSGSMMTNNMF